MTHLLNTLYQNSLVEPSEELKKMFDSIIHHTNFERFLENYNQETNWKKKIRTDVLLPREKIQLNNEKMVNFFNQLVILYEVKTDDSEDVFMNVKDKVEVFFYNPSDIHKKFLKFDITKQKIYGKNDNLSLYYFDLASAENFEDLQHAFENEYDFINNNAKYNALQIKHYFDATLNQKVNQNTLNIISVNFEKYLLEKNINKLEREQKYSEKTSSLKKFKI